MCAGTTDARQEALDRVDGLLRGFAQDQVSERMVKAVVVSVPLREPPLQAVRAHESQKNVSRRSVKGNVPRSGV